MKLHCFKLHRSYSVSFICQMLGKFSGVKSERTASKFRKRKRKLLCCVFTSSFKPVREIRRFHVAVVQRRLRNVQKSVMHVQSCCFDNVNLLLFLPFLLPSPSSLLKVPTVVIQKFCYHANVRSHFSYLLWTKRWMPQNSSKIQFDKTTTKSRAQTRNGELQPRARLHKTCT